MKQWFSSLSQISIATSLPLYAAIVTLLAGTIFHLVLNHALGESSRQNINQLGTLLASQLAAQSTQPLLNQDTLSLQFEVSEVVSLEGVANAYINDNEGRPLTEKITTDKSARLDKFSAPILIDGKKLANANIELDHQVLHKPYARLFIQSLFCWLILSAIMIIIAAKLGGHWRDRLTILARQLPALDSPEPVPSPREIGILEKQLTPLLLSSAERTIALPEQSHQSITSIELRGLTRLEAQLSQANFEQLLGKLDSCVAFLLKLYQGIRLATANQTLHLCFAGVEEDDHPVRALYAGIAFRQLIEKVETESGLKLDAAFALTSGDFSPDTAEFLNALRVEQQLKRAESLLKVASINELTLDNASATHPALDHIALLEPLNPEHTLFRCDGLSETAQTLVQRQLVFFRNDFS